MRSRTRDRQNVWFSKVTEEKKGFDTVVRYGAPTKLSVFVSATAGLPSEIAAGIVPDYDREIICYDRDFKAEEGMLLWVETEPELYDNREILLMPNGIDPVTPHDYRLVKILDTKKGMVARFGIQKAGAKNV